MPIRFFLSRLQVADGNGVPMAGAKLAFYITGTSTPKNTFSDYAMTVPNANPVIADGEGRFGDIWLEAGDYKVILKTAADVVVWTADPVIGAGGTGEVVIEAGTGSARVIGQRSGATRWTIRMPNSATESGGNAGSNFELARHSDGGSELGVALSIARATGNATFSGAATFGGVVTAGANGVAALDLVTKQQLDARALPVNVQTFTASGTWDKPSGYAAGSPVLIECWGGGGSGRRDSTAANAGGGGGGGYVARWMKLGDLGATETVTIGAGGASKTGSNQDGDVGGTTSFGAHLSAFGGGGGSTGRGGGGGGPGGPGATGTSNSSAGHGRGGLPRRVSDIGPGAGGDIGTYEGSGAWSDGTITFPGQVGLFHGGGGGALAGTPNGAGSVYGGGGGGAANSGTGGTSLYGGSGGAGAATGSAGTAPGGGGGGGSTTSGAGGNGFCRVHVFPIPE